MAAETVPLENLTFIDLEGRIARLKEIATR
jgi:hypothetical protein